METHLFDHLFKGVTCPEMEANISKMVRFKTPRCPIERELFRIGGIQRNWEGDIVYRLYFSGDTFGRCAAAEDILFVSETAA